MADINNNPDYSEPINDNPSKEELVPYFYFPLKNLKI